MMVGMTPKTKTKKKFTQKQIVNASARRHGVPTWLLWGIYGAESTYGTNGNNYFGLIEPEYRMANGNVRRPKNTADLAESSDIAAELLASLKQEHGSWAGAVAQYAPYSINHARELSTGGREQAGQTANVGFFESIPEGPLAGKIVEGILGTGGGAVGEAAGKVGEKALDATGLGGIAEFTKTLSKFLFTPQGWLQIGQVSGGIILIGWGLHHIIQTASGVNPTHTVTHAATKAAEVAAIVK
jgi:hypothetical protein